MDDITLTRDQFETFLSGLAQRDDRLVKLAPGERAAPDETVDAYAFSAYVEALRADDIDGDVWGTLEDLELEAPDEDAAWDAIKAFYLPRACVLLRVDGDEFVVGEELARRLGLPGASPTP
ncbi:hypothetical protein [Deinococcus pimensis]|uniref:hypothetical protein n=1 Tax=Deinococcus pimensis TaxID=309888 RepID=UPI000485227A|nr:hypothetical protein [Deinococcus pimensis]